MHAAAQAQAEPRRRFAHRARASQRARRPVEARNRAVRPLAHDAAAKALDLGFRRRMVVVHEIDPAAVAVLGRAARGLDDIGRDHGREHAVMVGAWPRAGQKLLDLVDHAVDVADPDQMIAARHLDIFGAVDVPGEILPAAHVHAHVLAAVEDQGRHPHR